MVYGGWGYLLYILPNGWVQKYLIYTVILAGAQRIPNILTYFFLLIAAHVMSSSLWCCYACLFDCHAIHKHLWIDYLRIGLDKILHFFILEISKSLPGKRNVLSPRCCHLTAYVRQLTQLWSFRRTSFCLVNRITCDCRRTTNEVRAKAEERQGNQSSSFKWGSSMQKPRRMRQHGEYKLSLQIIKTFFASIFMLVGRTIKALRNIYSLKNAIIILHRTRIN